MQMVPPHSCKHIHTHTESDTKSAYVQHSFDVSLFKTFQFPFISRKNIMTISLNRQKQLILLIWSVTRY